jgi:hypothetical protein
MCIGAPAGEARPVSVFVWVMIGIALWHGTVLLPDRFYGGLVGAFVAAVTGGLVSGYLLPAPGIPPHNPPGISEALWPVPGTLIALLILYRYGVWKEQRDHVNRELHS